MGQLGFDWNWAQRREWINEAVLDSGVAGDGRPGSASAMAGVLNAINDHLGDNAEAWPSQETIAQRLKVSTKTVQRACEALQASSLLIVLPKPCRSGTRNHYRIVWSELQLLQPARRAAWNAILRGQSNAADTELSASDTGQPPSDTLAEPSDTCDEASDTLAEPSDTVSDENYKKTKSKETTTVSRVGTATGPARTAAAPVVVSFERVLLDCGVEQANHALRMAREVLRLSEAEIAERIAAYQALPDPQQRPGVLYNWLAKPRSYTSFVKREQSERAPKQCVGLPPSVERERADLIQHGKRKGWDFATLQRAVTNFENRYLASARAAK